jgi:hypothetical protein
MTPTKQQVREVLDVYIRAWEGQDPRPHRHDLRRGGQLSPAGDR